MLSCFNKSHNFALLATSGIGVVLQLERPPSSCVLGGALFWIDIINTLLLDKPPDGEAFLFGSCAF